MTKSSRTMSGVSVLIKFRNEMIAYPYYIQIIAGDRRFWIHDRRNSVNVPYSPYYTEDILFSGIHEAIGRWCVL